MIVFAGFVIAAVGGALVAWLVGRTGSETDYLPPAGRQALVSMGVERSANLEQVIEAVRAAALRIELIENGFDVLAQPWGPRCCEARVRTWDRKNVRISTLNVYCSQPVRLLSLALALVPLFGPLKVLIDGDDWIAVDGTCDVLDLEIRLARRARVRMRRRLIKAGIL